MVDAFDTYREHFLAAPNAEMSFWIDFSRAQLPELSPSVREKLESARKEMEALEAGAISNQDEQRMVGHYWLRDSSRAPSPAMTEDIRATIEKIRQFASDVHTGKICGSAGKFTELLCIGIGGSALGPQFIADALGSANDKLQLHFIDNTDPDGFDRVFAKLKGRLGNTLVVVMSKSGGTPEPRNGLREAEGQWRAAGLNFEKHAIVVTGEGSELDKHAKNFLARFPMWDWVGGRTSLFGPVGLVPAALQGVSIDGLLQGSAEMDAWTRESNPARNPAAQLARSWLHLTEGKAKRAMVVLPYKDRLVLFSRYLQQLVMESLGKETDRSGKVVHQGLTVYGNKGSTDQHAYIQQLRDGPDDFFAVFIEVLRDRDGPSPDVEPGITSGDYLQAFLLGTREALSGQKKASLTLTVGRVDARSIGQLIALFERAVGIYASMLNINAYHQPGVEAGKRAAGEALQVLKLILQNLAKTPGQWRSVRAISKQIGLEGTEETVFKICLRLASNGRLECTPHPDPAEATFRL